MSNVSLGNMIRVQRKHHGLTQAQLSALLGVSRQTLIHMEQDKVTIPFHTMARLQRILNISLDSVATLLNAPESWIWWPNYPLRSGPVVAAIVGDHLVVAPVQTTLTQDISNGWWDQSTQTIQWYAREQVLDQIFIAGCDPFLPWLVRAFHENHSPFRLIPFSVASKPAIHALRSGFVHLAGSHLYDVTRDQYNHIAVGQEKWIYIGYLDWEEGRIFHNSTNPSTWALREPGSEALALWERYCDSHSVAIDDVRHFRSHQDLVRFVQSSKSQGVSIGSLAHLNGLEFDPWATEHYEWVGHPRDMEAPWFKSFIVVLEHTSLSRQLSALPHQRCKNWGHIRMD